MEVLASVSQAPCIACSIVLQSGGATNYRAGLGMRLRKYSTDKHDNSSTATTSAEVSDELRLNYTLTGVACGQGRITHQTGVILH